MSKPVRIDPEFQKRILPISADEQQQLEANLQRDGCRDPLVVWNEKNILLDGHHRYAICMRLNLKFTTTLLNFKMREAALELVDENQFGRRNLTFDLMNVLRGPIYNRMKHQGARTDRTSAHAEQKSDAATALGKKHNVSRATVLRDGQFAKAVESLKPVVPDIEDRVMTGKAKKAAVVAAARTPARAAEILTTPKRPPHVTYNTRDTNEWFTPPDIIAAARTVLGGIDLDPASCEEANQVVKADRIFTAQDDGLTQGWAGRVFMNPPYGSGLIERFVEKFLQHVKTCEITAAVVLVNNATDTRSFHELAKWAKLICFPKGRIKFRTPGCREPGIPVQGQALLYFNADESRVGTAAFIFNRNMKVKFGRAFAHLGFVVSADVPEVLLDEKKESTPMVPKVNPGGAVRGKKKVL